MINTEYPHILKTIAKYLDPKRSESASFLIWYFTSYVRLDKLDAEDSVCDQSGDKGIDAIYLNDDANTIEVYQAKLFQKENPKVGDKLLREFKGSLSQFASADSVQALVESAGEAEVSRLITRLDIIKHLSEYEVKAYFICNGELDANGQSFLDANSEINFIGKSYLEKSYVSAERNIPTTSPKKFDISGLNVSEYIVDSDHRAIVAPILAKELVSMEGIVNQAIFAFNVRGPLGRTGVNKDIAKSIADPSKHKLFPLFHNGITVVAESITKTDESIEVSNYFVVNGCQSISALYNNQKHLTDNLRILTKFIQASPSSPLSTMITKYSNNQNGVKARDFKANNSIQIRLQNEFKNKFGDVYFFKIKRGEADDGLSIIDNELAGQYLMAFDLKLPWATHRKYQIFEELHADLFGRPAVNCYRIVLCHILALEIEIAQSQIRNSLFAKYSLTKFFMLFILRLIIESDPSAVSLITNPERFVDTESKRTKLTSIIRSILGEMVTDLNAEIDQLGADFDYRGKLRDDRWCKHLGHEIASTRKKLVDRKRLDSFGQLWDSTEVL